VQNVLAIARTAQYLFRSAYLHV